MILIVKTILLIFILYGLITSIIEFRKSYRLSTNKIIKISIKIYGISYCLLLIFFAMILISS